MEKPEKKRILVLTSATGAGHDTHAYATTAWCAQLYGPDAEVIVDHTLEDSHPIYRKAVDFYNFIQVRAPWFHHIYYNIIELLEVLNPGTVSLGRDYYIQLLERVRPHAVISVMDCLNRGYFELARETLGAVKCATYCTEFSDGYGHSRNWVNPRTGYFFGRTDDTVGDALRRGVPPERTLVVGHWAPPAFYAPPLTAQEKASYLKDQLHLDPNLFTLLLSTGGNAAQNHTEILRTLLPLDDETIFASVGKTGKALIVHEDTKTGGIGAEVSARITENCFENLDGPVLRVAAPDTPVPYAPAMEAFFLPNAEKVARAARALAGY